MKWFRLLAVSALAALCLSVSPSKAAAQVTINIGVAPVCPYGYFNYPPYQCAPVGYYSPQWFASGVFIGAGPWFHGPEGFRGDVDEDFDPHYGYRGACPERGEHADWGRHLGWEKHFHGNAYRVMYHHDNGNHYGRYKDHDNHGNGNGHGHGHDEDKHDNGHGHDRD